MEDDITVFNRHSLNMQPMELETATYVPSKRSSLRFGILYLSLYSASLIFLTSLIAWLLLSTETAPTTIEVVSFPPPQSTIAVIEKPDTCRNRVHPALVRYMEENLACTYSNEKQSFINCTVQKERIDQCWFDGEWYKLYGVVPSTEPCQTCVCAPNASNKPFVRCTLKETECRKCPKTHPTCFADYSGGSCCPDLRASPFFNLTCLVNGVTYKKGEPIRYDKCAMDSVLHYCHMPETSGRNRCWFRPNATPIFRFGHYCPTDFFNFHMPNLTTDQCYFDGTYYPKDSILRPVTPRGKIVQCQCLTPPLMQCSFGTFI